MHDIKAIRENPDHYDSLWAKRGLEPQSGRIIDQDKLIRKALQVVQEAEQARNKNSKLIGQAMGKGNKEEADRLKAEVQGAKNVIAAMGAQVDSEKAALNDLLAGLPNLPFADVPEGDDEDSNVELRAWGEPAKFDFEPKAHDDLGTALGMMDFETAAKMSGARFVVLSGHLSRLDRALAAFMLDLQTREHGYTETSPPFMVRGDALYGTGQLPKFEEDLYKTDAGTYLIPTAEVSLTNLVRESIVPADSLPRRYTAHTPCFRSEAGAAGKDTKGMIRQHQFNKVELVSIVKPEDSEAEHERMLGCAEEVLKRLKLPHRVVELCTGDLGFGARRTFDIEVWLPSQDTYREISSCSNCGDFQARRMNARYKHAEKDNRFVHTLNGSGLAVGRTLVAVLENYQNADGSVTVPEVLVPYMGGVDLIK
jgi:seryl-tRNA synthetase